MHPMVAGPSQVRSVAHTLPGHHRLCLMCIQSSGTEGCHVTCRAQKRLLLLDYDGTLVPQSVISSRPTEEALSRAERGLCADAHATPSMSFPAAARPSSPSGLPGWCAPSAPMHFGHFSPRVQST